MRFLTMISGILLILYTDQHQAWASGKWCILRPEKPPCDGAPGKCTINSNLSRGGFIADTAYVEKIPILRLNRPYIGRYSEVCGEARVYGHARIDLRSRVTSQSEVFGEAHVSGHSLISGQAKIFDQARVISSNIGGSAQVFGHARISNHSRIAGHAKVSEFAKIIFVRVEGSAEISGNVYVRRAWITGNERLRGYQNIKGDGFEDHYPWEPGEEWP